MDVSLVYKIVAIAIVPIGVILAYFGGNKYGRLSGLTMGGAVSATGFILTLDLYSVFSKSIVGIMLSVPVVVFVTSAYFVTGKGYRVFFLLGALLYPIVPVNIFPLPWSVYFVYLAAALAAAKAHDDSGIDMIECLRKSGCYARPLLCPFAKIEKAVTKLTPRVDTRRTLMVYYFLTESALLLGIPLPVKSRD